VATVSSTYGNTEHWPAWAVALGKHVLAAMSQFTTPPKQRGYRSRADHKSYVAHLDQYLDRPTSLAAAYLRVSRGHPGTDAPERQAKDIVNHLLAKYPGCAVRSVFLDFDMSAWPGSLKARHRPGWTAMKAEFAAQALISDGDNARTGRLRYLVVTMLDRVVRSQHEGNTLLRDLGRAGSEIVSVYDQDIDPADDAHRTAAAVRFFVAEQASQDTSIRQRAKKQHLAQQGAWDGRPPFGHRIVDHGRYKTLVIDERTHPVFVKGVDMLLKGHKLIEVSQMYADHGFVDRITGLRKSPAGLRRLYRSPRVIGYRLWGVPPGCDGEAFWRYVVRTPAGEPIRFYPPLISDEQYAALAETLDFKKRYRAREPTHLLSGVLICGGRALDDDGSLTGALCGGKMYAHKILIGTRAGEHAFRCSQRHHYGGRFCTGTYTLESYIQPRVLDVMFSAEFSRQARVAWLGSSRSGHPKQGLYDSYAAELDAAHQRKHLLLLEFEAGQHDENFADFKTLLRRVNARIHDLETHVGEFTRLPQLQPDHMLDGTGLRAAWNTFPREVQRQVVRDRVEKVIVYPRVGKRGGRGETAPVPYEVILRNGARTSRGAGLLTGVVVACDGTSVSGQLCA
jgi:DNA invertase Pin-like site-specific DNA recombinase